jgi:hypothetical protein
VHFAAAANANFFLQEDDASDASLSEGELTAVGTPLQVARNTNGCLEKTALQSRDRGFNAITSAAEINRSVDVPLRG